MENKGVLESLGDYMRQVFDADKDGMVSVKEIFSVFPNMAIPIAIVFVDILVLASEYRVWDFGLYVTGDPVKAFGFVLVSAVPFLLGQVFWLYPRATWLQKSIAIGFVAVSLYTSAQFGLADLTATYEEKDIFSFLVELTAGYIVGTLIYIVFDPTIKANRMKRKAQDAAAFERELQSIGRHILSDLKETMDLKRSLESEFGSDEVAQALSQLRGKKDTRRPQLTTQSAPRPVQTPAMTANAATVTDHLQDIKANPTNGQNQS